VSTMVTMICCDREMMCYVVTMGGICEDIVRDLMAAAIEACFGAVDRVSLRIQSLSGSRPAYVAHGTQIFAGMMGLGVFMIPYCSHETDHY
jgi:hypothetical protein